MIDVEPAPTSCLRRVMTRFEKSIEPYDGLVHLACAFIAFGRLVK